MSIEKLKPVSQDDMDWWNLLGGEEVFGATESTRKEALQLRDAFQRLEEEKAFVPDPALGERLKFAMRAEANKAGPVKKTSRIKKPYLALAASVLCLALGLQITFQWQTDPVQWDESQWITKDFRIPDPIKVVNPELFITEFSELLTELEIPHKIERHTDAVHLRAIITRPVDTRIARLLNIHNVTLPTDNKLWVEVLPKP